MNSLSISLSFCLTLKRCEFLVATFIAPVCDFTNESASMENESMELGGKLWYQIISPFNKVSPNFFNITDSISSSSKAFPFIVHVRSDMLIRITGSVVLENLWHAEFHGNGV